MISREEALQRADGWINRSRPASHRIEIGIHEFERGYVVWRAERLPEDLERPPTAVGPMTGVIDKETGDFTLTPSLPPALVPHQYGRDREDGPTGER
ncbi:MAG: hypothetical protein ACRDN9_15460 [Streptosporangiaceae bacterium]